MFVIDEGPELRVRGIEFVGNRTLPWQELAEVVSVRPYPWLGLGGGGYVTARQMEQDVERIVEHYRSRGFLEATARADAATSREALGQLGAVVAGAETASRDARQIFVRYTIEEGRRAVLASQDFRTDDGGPLPYGKSLPAREREAASGRPLHPGGGARGRQAPRPAARRRRLPRRHRRSRGEPHRRSGRP